MNLGHVRFDNGVLGIIGGVRWRQVICYYVSYDNGISWEYCSDVARVDPNLKSSATQPVGYAYPGLRRLPDGRLMACMYKTPSEMICVAFSEDDGMTWSPLRFVSSPGNRFW